MLALVLPASTVDPLSVRFDATPARLPTMPAKVTWAINHAPSKVEEVGEGRPFRRNGDNRGW